jgi:hypothetical protein
MANMPEFGREFWRFCKSFCINTMKGWKDFTLTPPLGAHTISPESSDGFASVGTILPEGKAALLPGGLFRFWG